MTNRLGFVDLRSLTYGPLWITALVLIGCHPVTVDGRALEGTWGADGAELQADSKGAVFQYNCAEVTIPGPLRPGANGEFILDAARRRVGGPPPQPDEVPEVVMVHGQVSESTNDLDLVISRAPNRQQGSVSQETFSLRRGPGVVLPCP